MIYQCDNRDLKNDDKAYMKKPPLPMKGSKIEPMHGNHVVYLWLSGLWNRILFRLFALIGF